MLLQRRVQARVPPLSSSLPQARETFHFSKRRASSRLDRVTVMSLNRYHEVPSDGVPSDLAVSVLPLSALARLGGRRRSWDGRSKTGRGGRGTVKEG